MNILLLTDMPPCVNSTAGIVLNQLCDFLMEEGHTISCFAIMHPFSPDIPNNKKEKILFNYVKRPLEGQGIKLFGYTSSFIDDRINALWHSRRIAKQATKFARENNVEFIWAIAEGSTMIRVIERVASITRLPYSVQVWDPPEWALYDRKCDSFSAKSIMKSFGNILKKAKYCIAASWTMAEEYSKKYGCKSIPVILSFNNDITERTLSKNDDIIISFCGQIYCRKEIFNLILALRLMNWKYKNKNIILRMYGNAIDISWLLDCDKEKKKALFDNNVKNFLLQQSGGITKQICIFCAGNWGSKLNEELAEHGLEVAFFCDNDEKKWGEKIHGLPCISLSELIRQKNDTFIIIAKKYPEEIVKQLNALRIPLMITKQEFSKHAYKIGNIELCGWRPQDKLLQELAQSDFLYCPYWFDKKYEIPAKLSFPTKLCTYLKTGRPVIMHGPEYCSPRIFLEKHNAAFVCGDNVPEKIRDCLIHILQESEDKQKTIGKNGYNAFLKNLTKDKMKLSFLKSLDL